MRWAQAGVGQAHRLQLMRAWIVRYAGRETAVCSAVARSTGTPGVGVVDGVAQGPDARPAFVDHGLVDGGEPVGHRDGQGVGRRAGGLGGQHPVVEVEGLGVARAVGVGALGEGGDQVGVLDVARDQDLLTLLDVRTATQDEVGIATQIAVVDAVCA